MSVAETQSHPIARARARGHFSTKKKKIVLPWWQA
jgi:hypothetical protein